MFWTMGSERDESGMKPAGGPGLRMLKYIFQFL